MHGGIKSFTEGLKQFAEVSNNSQTYQIIHGEGLTIRRGIK